jgi:hypothetical protein
VIDPSELRALDLALEHFDSAYTGVVQAARRVLILASENEAKAPEPAKPALPPEVARVVARREAVAKGYTGSTCTHCGGFNVRQSGVCTVCADCGTSGGCS